MTFQKLKTLTLILIQKQSSKQNRTVFRIEKNDSLFRTLWMGWNHCRYCRLELRRTIRYLDTFGWGEIIVGTVGW